MRRQLPAAVLAAGASLAAAAAAEAGNGGFAPVSPESPGAEGINDIYYFISFFAAIVFLLVTVPLLVFVARYRSNGRSRDAEGPQIRGNRNLELAWTAVPVLILAAVTAFVFYKLPGIDDPEEARAGGPGEPLEVKVEGRRFYWQYVYPNGVIAIDRLRLPVGRTVEVALTAPPRDVIHSYWVPALGGKRDAIPGQTTRFEFRPERVGTYQGVCGEFCGVQHTAMTLEAEVIPQEEFERWLADQKRQQEARSPALGGEIWTRVCAKCHDPEIRVGPELVGNPILADREALEVVVRNGRGAMPPVGEGWSEDQMAALAKFARTLAGNGGEGGEDDGGES